MSLELVFKIILICFYTIFTIIRINFSILARKNHRNSEIKESKFRLTLLQSYISITVILFFLYIFLPSWFSWGSIPYYPIALRWFGVGLGGCSLILFTFVHFYLGHNFSYTLQISDDHQLITSGPYRFIRHPMYSAFFLLHIAIFFVSANWFIGIIWILGLIIIISLRITKEEEMLIETFNERYIDYKRRTGALLPPIFKLFRKDTRDKIRNGLWSYYAISNLNFNGLTNDYVMGWFSNTLESFKGKNDYKFQLTAIKDNKNEDSLAFDWNIITVGLLFNHQLELSCIKNPKQNHCQLKVKAKGKKQFIRSVRKDYEQNIENLDNYNIIFYGP